MGVWGIRPSFPGLSPCPGQVAYVLLTSAPVAAKGIATTALPLDLHVLSLSLAFILSQDQTLRCCIIVSYLFQDYNENATLDRSSSLALDDSCSIVLYYVLELTGTIFVPVLLYYVNCCKHVKELF